MSARQGGLHSTIVRSRGVTSYSTVTWLRTCSGTRCWHQRRTRATSSSGRPASVTLTVCQRYSREQPTCCVWRRFRNLSGGGEQSQCRVMVNFTELVSVPSEHPVRFTDQRQ